MFKLVQKLNPTRAMKSFIKTNCILCMGELLTNLNKLHKQNLTLMNKNSRVYGDWRHKTFHQFYLRTDGYIVGWKVYTMQ